MHILLYILDVIVGKTFQHEWWMQFSFICL